MIFFRLKTVGTSVVLEIPDEMLAHLKARGGDILVAIETTNGYLLAAKNMLVENQLKAGREFMGEYRETLKELAK